MSNTYKIWAVIPAAGVGKRMQSAVPKQYLSINDKTILEHTIACFSTRTDISGIMIALSSEDEYFDNALLSKERGIYRTIGGNERSDSVLNALIALDELDVGDEDWVLVHDAARPCVEQVDINLLIQQCVKHKKGGILAMPVRDTMKRQSADTKTILHTESRDGLWHALTPQMFRLGELREALEQSVKDGFAVTDEASAMEHCGIHPLLIESSSSNIKVTRPTDLKLATFFLNEAGV
ncbi:MAG: 2-C-methyl-D-erythritol 4-phosphate cytidylyltransferase (EC [uncultured Thiotrichaceae bacterium]|uniref:2-C-methyl-D-erythritol 4-phosphate cytidylyltransferase n=1 Tax=uncultured Thiotrichaceae bacterium TaxID=298394 RepID=A0A6S6U2P2_9GAMM|nr:MAG: 2-C-methyl-D-erythritol 4-phosphate cytidylyltransferase (EC [uncultured Thiotrichaceae bacterium]